MTDPVEPFAPALADRYRVERELGAGGMAVVYLAHDVRHDRKVALKLLRRDVAAALGVDRFLQEIRTTANLQHPHILPLFDSGALPDEQGRPLGRPWYVMPFIEGESLRQRLDRERHLPVDEAVRLTAEVADALATAHRQGIVHRDIKPENILLSGGHAIVGDFGIARAVSASTDQRLTGTGVSVGTPAYMSPEQATGDAVDERTDIYALGCILYEMLAGQPPHSGPTAQAIIARRLSDPVPSLRTVRDTVPDGLERIVSRALARIPADRYASAGEFLQALRQVEMGERGAGTAAPGARPAGPAQLPGSRRGLVALGITAAAVFLTVMIARGRENPRAEESSLDPRRVAVGVFENQTGDTAMAPLGRMAADWVVQGLVNTGSLHVLDAATLYLPASSGSGTPNGAIELARSNGAGLAVAGRYYRSGDSVLFAAAVFDVATGQVRGSLDPVGAGVHAPLIAIDELRQRLAAVLMTMLDPRAQVFPAETSPPLYDAYREFIAGQELAWRGQIFEAIPVMRRALARDTSFLAAAVALSAFATTANQCELADSINRELERRAGRLSRAQGIIIEVSRMRCSRDWTRGIELGRQRLASDPGSGFAKWSLAAAARRANRPGEALGILQELTERDLAWVTDEDKIFYWREVVTAHHMAGDTAAERQVVATFATRPSRRLAFVYLKGLSLAVNGTEADLLQTLDGVETMASDPVLAAGEIAGRSSPDRVATPGWVLYQLATELRAHDRDALARALAERASRWAGSRSGDEAGRPETRYLRALSLEVTGETDSALALVEALVREAPGNVEYRGRLGILAARQGDRRRALEADQWLAALGPVFPPNGPQLERARIAAVLGEPDRALQLLETIPYGTHPADFVFFHSDPAFATLRRHPRWAGFLRPRG